MDRISTCLMVIYDTSTNIHYRFTATMVFCVQDGGRRSAWPSNVVRLEGTTWYGYQFIIDHIYLLEHSTKQSKKTNSLDQTLPSE